VGSRDRQWWICGEGEDLEEVVVSGEGRCGGLGVGKDVGKYEGASGVDISCGSFFLDIEREGVGVVLALFNSRCLVDGT
jgi:hypothetical protein